MEADRPSEDPTVEQLVDQLGAIAVRLVPGVFGVAGGYNRKPLDPLEKIDELTEIVKRSFLDEWRNGKLAALELTLRKAIGRLEGAFCELPAGDGRARPRMVTNQEAALRYFNFESSLPKVESIDFDHPDYEGIGGGPYNKVFAALRKKTGLADRALRGKLTDLRRKLAKVLLDPAFPFTAAPTPVQTSEVVAVRSTLADEYIPRLEHERRIRQLRDAGASRIWLWGDAGTGKSRLARAANRDLVAEGSVRVLNAAADPAEVQQDIASLIGEYRTDAIGINATNVWAEFNRLLADTQGPPVVVFDDVAPNSPLLRRIALASRTLVMFTSNHRLPGGGPTTVAFAGDAIEVRDLTADDATEMIRSRLPGVSEADLALLRVVLGGRPLAIEHGCAFIRMTGMPVAEYCQALVERPAELLDNEDQDDDEQYGRTLTRAYRLTLQRLASSEGALRALDLIAFGATALTLEALTEAWVDQLELPDAMPDPSQLSQDYMRSASLWVGAWPGVKFVNPTRFPDASPSAKAALYKALQRLEALGLVRLDNGLLVMHQLTAAIFRNLREEQMEQVFDRMLRAAYAMVTAENWQGGDLLTSGRLPWAPRLRAALSRLASDVQRLWTMPVDELVRLVTVAGAVLRADRQVGADPRTSFDNARRFATAAVFRHSDPDTVILDEQAYRQATLDAVMEALEFLVLWHQFDHSIDSFPRTGEAPTAEDHYRGNSVRLKYHTEWELAHHYVDAEVRKEQAKAARQAAVDKPNYDHVRASAVTATAAAMIHYDRAEWDAAVDALEHAYGCYLEVGASMECIRGAMDTARWLSRVHLRAGRLIDARAWVERIRAEVFPRTDTRFQGTVAPFRLRDLLTEHQLVQALNELELTEMLERWDSSDADMNEHEMDAFIEPRLDLARRAVNTIVAIRARRLLPEFALYAGRLEMLTQSTAWTASAGTWFEQDKHPYQTHLLGLQIHVISAPFWCEVFIIGEDESLAEVNSPEAADAIRQLFAARHKVPEGIYWASREMMEKYNNPYWYARGLCAATLMGMAVGLDKAWVLNVRNEAEQLAAQVGRPDWIGRVDTFGQSNTGLWLYGY